jgi:hypothetical protein
VSDTRKLERIAAQFSSDQEMTVGKEHVQGGHNMTAQIADQVRSLSTINGPPTRR